MEKCARISLLYIPVFLLILSCKNEDELRPDTDESTASEQIIADHTVINRYDNIPQQYIEEVKKMWLVLAGESHSAAYRNGLNALEALDPKYQVNVTESGTPESATTSYLRVSRGTWGDLTNESGWIYNYGEEDWCAGPYPAYQLNPAAVSRTKAGISYCKSNNLTISAFGFGWCYDDGLALVHSYINATKEYIKFCNDGNVGTKVFFTTGPVDGYIGVGEAGYINSQRWAIIRDTADNDVTRILFDYADILTYNDAGEQATTDWNGHTFPTIHPENMQGSPAGGHIGGKGALKLGKAMWWMLARMAGWDGK